jgi:hypothetical protein
MKDINSPSGGGDSKKVFYDHYLPQFSNLDHSMTLIGD